MTSAVITQARITAMPRPMPQGMFDPMPKVMVTIGNEPEQELFSYYPDEISFTANEFVGLTVTEASDLKYKKDLAYLKS